MLPDERPSAVELAVAALAPEPASPGADGSPAAVGIACPDCGCRDLRVVKTRRNDLCIARRRQCRHCGRRITTLER